MVFNYYLNSQVRSYFFQRDFFQKLLIFNQKVRVTKCNFEFSLQLLMSLSIIGSYSFVSCSKKGEAKREKIVI